MPRTADSKTEPRPEEQFCDKYKCRQRFYPNRAIISCEIHDGTMHRMCESCYYDVIDVSAEGQIIYTDVDNSPPHSVEDTGGHDSSSLSRSIPAMPCEGLGCIDKKFPAIGDNKHPMEDGTTIFLCGECTLAVQSPADGGQQDEPAVPKEEQQTEVGRLTQMPRIRWPPGYSPEETKGNNSAPPKLSKGEGVTSVAPLVPAVPKEKEHLTRRSMIWTFDTRDCKEKKPCNGEWCNKVTPRYRDSGRLPYQGPDGTTLFLCGPCFDPIARASSKRPKEKSHECQLEKYDCFSAPPYSPIASYECWEMRKRVGRELRRAREKFPRLHTAKARKLIEKVEKAAVKVQNNLQPNLYGCDPAAAFFYWSEMRAVISVLHSVGVEF